MNDNKYCHRKNIIFYKFMKNILTLCGVEFNRALETLFLIYCRDIDEHFYSCNSY